MHRLAPAVLLAAVALSATACGSNSAAPTGDSAQSVSPSPSSLPADPTSSSPTSPTSGNPVDQGAGDDYTADQAALEYAQGLRTAWLGAPDALSEATARDRYTAVVPSGPAAVTVAVATNSAKSQSVAFVCAAVDTKVAVRTVVLYYRGARILSDDEDGGTPKRCGEPVKGAVGVDDIHLDLSSPLTALRDLGLGTYNSQVSLAQNTRTIGDVVDHALSKDKQFYLVKDHSTAQRSDSGGAKHPFVYVCASNGVSALATGFSYIDGSHYTSFQKTVDGTCAQARRAFNSAYPVTAR